MAQHDYVAANGSGAVVRGDFNDALLAVATMNSGASAPSVTYSYMPYVNTSDGHLYQRNAANTGWIDHGSVASGLLRLEDVAAGGSAGLLRSDGDGSGLSGIAALPAGSVFWFGAEDPPTGSLVADGSAISRTTYSDLFAAYGVVFGAGDGSTTFNIPDLRGEFIRGWDDGRGVDSGRVFGASQLDQMQGHRHGTIGGDSFVVNTGGGIYAAGGAGGGDSATGSPVSDTTNGTPRTGSETRPRNVALLPCVKY
ncbi:phage tail protein [Thalassospira sp.]|uniref:phage tail protein n=1 Tax=Thalassospira sp. TaxID=1912094 RepID=UPI000C69E604|nr:phage tail protein [Thalassospira sp.]MBC05730.1 hypothetical protein [Thalassospira sp.]